MGCRSRSAGSPSVPSMHLESPGSFLMRRTRRCAGMPLGRTSLRATLSGASISALNDASRELVRGAVYGHLVGDAIGVPYEFGHHIETVELRGHGTHNQRPGTWSDDGALMLALLDSLVSVGFDPEDQGRRALAWWDERAYTPDGDGAFDIGSATSTALHRLRAGVPAIDAGGTEERDQGNGSLMRILP